MYAPHDWQYPLLVYQKPSAKNMCFIACTFTKITYILTPHYLFGAVSQRYLKCCLPDYSHHFAPKGGTTGKELACQCRRHKETWVRSLGWEDPLEEGMETRSSILAWRIPWTEEPGGL